VSFAWDYLDADGAAIGRSETFSGREEAEAWMGDAWEELLAQGIQEVALVDLAREVRIYRMGLEQA
jgi:hypothetical protein